MKSRSYIISLFLIISYSLNAQLISVRSSLSKDTISIGEQLEYSFSVETSEGAVAEFPVFYDTISSSLEVLELIGVDSIIAENKVITTGTYRVTSFEKGANIIHPKAVRFSSGEITDTAYSLPLTLSVISPDVDTTQAIKPIKPPVNTPVSFMEVLPWAGIGLGGLALIAGLYFLIRRYLIRRKHPELIGQKPKEPAHVIALRSLDKLKEDKVMESSNAKLYYTRLTEIIRTYIYDQYGLQAMESTSAEIMDEFKLVNLEKKELNDMLEELLQLADLVKFAKEDPLRKEKEIHLNNAYDFVRTTYQLLAEAEAESTQEEISDQTNIEKEEER